MQRSEIGNLFCHVVEVSLELESWPVYNQLKSIKRTIVETNFMQNAASVGIDDVGI